MIRRFKKLCKKEAIKIILQVQDYQNSGYTILGIISTKDSPTCAYTKTINFLRIIPMLKDLAIKDGFENPTLEKIKNIIPSLCENGSGYIFAEIVKLMRRSELDVEIIGL